MLRALLTFLVGCLVLAVIVYVFHLMLGLFTLDPQLSHVVLVIVGLIGLVCLIILSIRAFKGQDIW